MKKILIAVMLIAGIFLCGFGKADGVTKDVVVGTTRLVVMGHWHEEEDVAVINKIRSEGWELITAQQSRYWFKRVK